MTRIEWTRLGGDEVENVVALLINREKPDSERIRPSAGDGGVDILDRAAGPGGTDVVYQVKRFTAPLTSKQKASVKDSLRALTSDPRWGDLTVGSWRLVMPLNPSPEAEHWLQNLAFSYQLSGRWLGLDFVEGLAAKYPEVVDYYLHGGRNRIEHSYQALMAFQGLDTSPLPTEVPGAVNRISAALEVLRQDPLYRYELSFGEGPLPAHQVAPGTVIVAMWGDESTGLWNRVDVFARCAVATELRPIKLKGTLSAKGDAAFAAQLRNFHQFGVPFTSPDGAFSGTIDAPGGLGGFFEGAKVQVSPVSLDSDGDEELVLEVVDPDVSVLEEATVKLVNRSRGADGDWAVYRELSGVFVIEERRVDGGQFTTTIGLGRFEGAAVTEVGAALRFLAALRPPNNVRISRRHTPTHLGRLATSLISDWTSESEAVLSALSAAIADLAVIQQNTSNVIRVPDFRTLLSEQSKEWNTAVRLLGGESVVLHQNAVVIDLGDETFEHLDLKELTFPYSVEVGDQTLDLGVVTASVEDPEMRCVIDEDGGSHLVIASPDQMVTVKLTTNGQDPSDPSDSAG